MFKRLLILMMCVCLCCMVGCSKKEEALSAGKAETSAQEETNNGLAVNPLTGLRDISADIADNRPVAVTVNNISIAQPVQTGVGKADIVYETEVEGGITRLVALYQNISSVEKIGTVRSARYAFIDLAMGHNAIYVHHGQDSYHAGPHLGDVDRFVVGPGKGGARISNGLASEHTLYAYGDGLWNAIKSAGIKTENGKTSTWQNFADEKKAVTLSNSATSVSVPFSNSYKTTFQYDSESGKYIRYFNGTQRKDYSTGEALYFKNVFVLNTTIRTYSNCNDGYNHREVVLSSGDGYYFVNGTYTPIKWSKGSASNGLTFTNTDGTKLTVNPGNSWVCIAGASTSQPVIQ